MKSIILEEHTLFDEFFSVVKGKIQHDLYEGNLSSPFTRYSYNKGDAVAALLIDSNREELIIVEQYRYPADRWILELVAGGLEQNEDPVAGITREILEESGHQVLNLESLGLMYVAPGVFSERVHLYICEVRPATLEELMGVEQDEGEDICLVRIPFKYVSAYLELPMDDLKTKLAILQWMLKQKI